MTLPGLVSLLRDAGALLTVPGWKVTTPMPWGGPSHALLAQMETFHVPTDH